MVTLLELGAGFGADFSGRENIYLNGALHGFEREEIEARMDDIVAFSELGEFIDLPVKVYSSGMFLRLGFSIAAHLDADVMLIDEILAVGDESFQRKCLARISERMEARGHDGARLPRPQRDRARVPAGGGARRRAAWPSTETWPRACWPTTACWARPRAARAACGRATPGRWGCPSWSCWTRAARRAACSGPASRCACG